MTLEKEKNFYLETLNYNLWNYSIKQFMTSYELYFYNKRVVCCTNLYDFVEALRKYTVKQLKSYNLL